MNQLTDKDKHALREASRAMADAGRIDCDSAMTTAQQANSMFPTAQQAADNLMRNLKALRSMGL